MQLVPNGPVLPPGILAAHEEGTLVVLCGAGLSVPNGLPLFDGLVSRVWKSLGSKDIPDFEGLMESGGFDRALGYLEAEYGAGRVREEISSALSLPRAPDLSTQKAVLALGTTRNGRVQLVTTNFDLLFEAAEPGLRVHSAPMLPVPKPGKWDGLVHLHGRLSVDDPEGKHLVMTSADFGVAYLVERWASRFVSELFAHYTVLFLGYGVNDPVMRYLVDALAAERGSDRRVKEAYAFVGARPEADLGGLELSWKRRNVVPIPYVFTTTQNGGQDHSLLYETVRKWADLYSGGLESRKNVAYEFGTVDPRGLSEDDRSRFLWAIEDPDVVAHLADIGAETSFGWVPLLSDQIGKAASLEDLVVAMVGNAGSCQSPPRLNHRSREFARWLASHAPNPDFVKWVVAQGGHVHPELGSFLQTELERQAADGTPRVPLAVSTVWRGIMSDDAAGKADRGFEWYDLVAVLRRPSWSPELRRQVLNALTPQLRFRNSFSGLLGSSKGNARRDSDDLRVTDLAWAEIELGADDVAESIQEALLARNDKAQVLSDLAFDLTSLLRSALDILASVEMAGPDWDPGESALPSIAPHPQNGYVDGWGHLIILNREAFNALLTTDPARADRLAEEWAEIEYPTFRRLVLYAVGQALGDPDDA